MIKARQPLCDLSPFDSVFLILQRVGVGARLFPPCFPSCPEVKTLATYLAFCPCTTLAERLSLPRYSATALAEERAFPLGIPTLVGGLIVSPEQNQQQ